MEKRQWQIEHNNQDIFHFIENDGRPIELSNENQLFGRLKRELVLQFPLYCEKNIGTRRT